MAQNASSQPKPGKQGEGQVQKLLAFCVQRTYPGAPTDLSRAHPSNLQLASTRASRAPAINLSRDSWQHMIHLPMPAAYPRPHGVQAADAPGAPVSFTSGFFAGRTLRVELEEIQKADLGRKYLDVSRSSPDGRVQEVAVDPEFATLGAVCHVDLFPLPDTFRQRRPDSQYNVLTANTTLPSLHTGSWDVPSSTPQPSQLHGFSVHQTTAPSTLYDRRNSNSSAALPSLHPLGIIGCRGSAQRPTGPSFRSIRDHVDEHPNSMQGMFDEPGPTSGILPSLQQLAPMMGYPPPPGGLPFAQDSGGYAAPRDVAEQKPDVVAYFGDFAIRESSCCTGAISGSTFLQPSVIEHNGKKVLVFVFSDLAVKLEGTFVLRYRTLNVYSQCAGHKRRPILAECYGGPFDIYSTKDFPGLRPSTDLTKARTHRTGADTPASPRRTQHLALYGVRVHIREHERKRRKQPDAAGTADHGTAGAGGSPTSVGHVGRAGAGGGSPESYASSSSQAESTRPISRVPYWGGGGGGSGGGVRAPGAAEWIGSDELEVARELLDLASAVQTPLVIYVNSCARYEERPHYAMMIAIAVSGSGEAQKR
ncbi:velvet factor-domain-containing protein [Trametes elegans]|nr:velvet factor-domain-containing protein [Trametes elegans]